MSSNKRKSRDGLALPPAVAPKKGPGVKKEKEVVDVAAIATSAAGIEDKNSSADSKTDENVNVDEHPLKVGHYLIVKYRDGSNRLAKIVERSSSGSSSTTTTSSPRSIQYYIHYYDFNRRMDEWINATRIVAFPSEANPIGAAKEAEDSHAKKLKEAAATASVAAGNNTASATTTADGSSTGVNASSSATADEVSSTNKSINASSPAAVAPAASTASASNKKSANKKTPAHASSSSSSSNTSSSAQKATAASVAATAAAEKAAQNLKVKLDLIAANANNTISTVSEMEHDEHEGMDEASLLEHEEITKIKNIKLVKLGKYIMECWYFSPFPKEYYPNGYAECLYFCEFSFRFFATKEELVRYQKKPGLPRHPPGNEIYRDNDVSMFELDGAVEKIYCQNLCYFAKLFLDHKTLYWDVDPFLFYVLCTRDDRGFHPVGYFSKEK